MKRRRFLQFSGSSLAALGLTQAHLQRQGWRYGQVLAQPTSRKLALLVGVNQYRQSDRFTSLKGSAMDVELQRQLLIHRFGFLDDNICILSDEPEILPTRDNILKAFDEHLIKQAKIGDVVVFHFSGHGSRVLDPNPIHSDGLNSTFVPGDVDGDVTEVDDITGYTLFLLLSALETDQVTVVLDCCFSGGGTRGNIRIRSANGGRYLRSSEREVQEQDKWLSYLGTKRGLSRDGLRTIRDLGVAKGVYIAASQRDQLAADVTFDGFDAGAFTYLMTQFLWQQTDSVQGTVARIRADLRQNYDQLPLHDVEPGSGYETSTIYFTDIAHHVSPAEAVITNIDGPEATLWLGGVHPDVIATYRQGTTLFLPNNSAEPVIITKRQGLSATTSNSSWLEKNMLLQEAVRIVPGNLSLAIGIDSSLATRQAEIQTQLQELPYVNTVLPGDDGTYGTEVHYILGRMTSAYRELFVGKTNLPKDNAIGLFFPSFSTWLVGSFQSPEEPLHSALNYIKIRLQSLLAVRLIKLSLNAQVAQLAVEAKLVSSETGHLIAEAGTVRPSLSSGSISAGPSSSSVRVNEPIQFQITNLESFPLYIGILDIPPSGVVGIVFPKNVSQDAVLQPGSRQLVPALADQTKLIIKNPGFYESIVVASRKPLKRALQNLNALGNGERQPGQADPQEDLGGFNGLFEAIYSDRDNQQTISNQALSTQDLVSLAMTFEVILEPNS